MSLHCPKSKHYLFCQIFRFLGWVCALDLARAKERARGTPEEQAFNEIDIRKEAVGMLLCTSQKHWEEHNWVETRVDGIGCLCLRLE